MLTSLGIVDPNDQRQDIKTKMCYIYIFFIENIMESTSWTLFDTLTSFKAIQ